MQYCQSVNGKKQNNQTGRAGSYARPNSFKTCSEEGYTREQLAVTNLWPNARDALITRRPKNKPMKERPLDAIRSGVARFEMGGILLLKPG